MRLNQNIREAFTFHAFNLPLQNYFLILSYG